MATHTPVVALPAPHAFFRLCLPTAPLPHHTSDDHNTPLPLLRYLYTPSCTVCRCNSTTAIPAPARARIAPLRTPSRSIVAAFSPPATVFVNVGAVMGGLLVTPSDYAAFAWRPVCRIPAIPPRRQHALHYGEPLLSFLAKWKMQPFFWNYQLAHFPRTVTTIRTYVDNMLDGHL